MRFLARRRQSRTPIELNVIPLIDVVFFLLIFYVISTSFVQETALPIQRPQSDQATTVHGGFVPVAIISSGDVMIGSQVLSLSAVAPAVRTALETGNTQQVVVIPDRDVPSGLLLQVMDACTAGGATSVDVAATRESQ